MTLRIQWILPVVCAACVVPGTAQVELTAGSPAPPPPQVVMVAQPAVEPVSGGVYVVTDPSVQYDMFQFGATWYLYSGGYWYRAPGYRGPYAVVDARHVPRQVLNVPPGNWKHRPPGGPPGLARQGRHEG